MGDGMNDGERSQARPERSDAAANRERILETARLLFAEHGVAATSLNMIAHTAQVGPGTLYRRFANKGELCQALLAFDVRAFEDDVATIVDGPQAPASALDRLEGVLHALLRMTEGHIPLLAATLDGTWKAPRLSPFQTPFYQRLSGRIEALLTMAVAQGEAHDLDAAWTSDAILTAMTPDVLMYQQQERGFSHERIVGAVRRLVVNGVRPGG